MQEDAEHEDLCEHGHSDHLRGHQDVLLVRVVNCVLVERLCCNAPGNGVHENIILWR